jgi:transitional endoplasmic reticulum ATPase
MSAEPDHAHDKKRVHLHDASGAEKKEELDTSTAILKKKKKPNSLM